MIVIVVGMGYVRAVYDYSADGPDEISFAAGSLIALLSRDENGMQYKNFLLIEGLRK